MQSQRCRVVDSVKIAIASALRIVKFHCIAAVASSVYRKVESGEKLHWRHLGFIGSFWKKGNRDRCGFRSCLQSAWHLQFRVVLDLRTRFLALLKLTSQILCLHSEIAERQSFSAVIEQSQDSFKFGVPMKEMTEVWACGSWTNWAHVPF